MPILQTLLWEPEQALHKADCRERRGHWDQKTVMKNKVHKIKENEKFLSVQKKKIRHTV